MKLSDVICGVPISAGEQEEAKRRRELRIRQFLEEGPICLIRLTLNIIGPVKSFPMALDAFHEGVCAIRRELSSFSSRHLAKPAGTASAQITGNLRKTQEQKGIFRFLKKAALKAWQKL